MAKKKSSVLIVDDQLSVAAGLQLLLEKHNFTVVAIVDQAKNLPAAVKQHKPELVLIDTSMPGADPLGAAEKVVKTTPETKVVFFGDCTDHLLDKCAELGVVGFVSKSERPEQLILAIQQAMDGTPYFSPEADRRLVKTRGIKARSRYSTLSPREREVLRYLAQDLSVREVATELGVRPTTVETHRQSLRAKLDIRGAAGMARFALKEGLIE